MLFIVYKRTKLLHQKNNARPNTCVNLNYIVINGSFVAVYVVTSYFMIFKSIDLGILVKWRYEP